jgi:hypothetical protein
MRGAVRHPLRVLRRLGTFVTITGVGILEHFGCFDGQPKSSRDLRPMGPPLEHPVAVEDRHPLPAPR